MPNAESRFKKKRAEAMIAAKKAAMQGSEAQKPAKQYEDTRGAKARAEAVARKMVGKMGYNPPKTKVSPTPKPKSKVTPSPKPKKKKQIIDATDREGFLFGRGTQ